MLIISLLTALAVVVIILIEVCKSRNELHRHLDYVTKKAVESLTELGELQAELEQERKDNFKSA